MDEEGREGSWEAGSVLIVVKVTHFLKSQWLVCSCFLCVTSLLGTLKVHVLQRNLVTFAKELNKIVPDSWKMFPLYKLCWTVGVYFSSFRCGALFYRFILVQDLKQLCFS